MIDKVLDRTIGSLVGLACGDAVGTTLEFKPKGSFEPIEDMIGGGPFDLTPGEWTDDTSMALCLGHSLVQKQGFDAADQMNRYCNWYQFGYMSSNGRCFDIGITVTTALQKYLNDSKPFAGSTDPNTAGNGSLMRLCPVAIFYRDSPDDAIFYAGQSSKTTHGCEEAVESCQLFCAMLQKAFYGATKQEILSQQLYQPNSPSVAALANRSFLTKSYEELTGSGYVIESLESALWCFYHADSFEQAILLAANLGNDADTTAAICGQIAGAYYGVCAIPEHWKGKISQSDEIIELAKKLTRAR